MLGRFLSADTIVPRPGNPQSLNRYAYVSNNPLKYIDPTGHMQACPDNDCGTPGTWTPPLPTPTSSDNANNENHAHRSPGLSKPASGDNRRSQPQRHLCDYAPFFCQYKPLNPFAYDTVGIAFPFQAKLGGGITGQPVLYFNAKSLKEFDLQNFDLGIFVNYQFSIGVSEMAAKGVGIIGANGSVLDQLGSSLLDGNAAGCISIGCGGVSGSLDSNANLQSIQWWVGAGEGFDLSIGKSVTDFGFYAKGNTVTAKLPLAVIPIPFLNQTWTFHLP